MKIRQGEKDRERERKIKFDREREREIEREREGDCEKGNSLCPGRCFPFADSKLFM